MSIILYNWQVSYQISPYMSSRLSHLANKYISKLMGLFEIKLALLIKYGGLGKREWIHTKSGSDTAAPRTACRLGWASTSHIRT